AYVWVCHSLIRLAVVSFIILGVITFACYSLGKRIPTSFLPDEDQGFVYAALQLPDASSLQRTDAVTRQAVEDILKVPGVEAVSSVSGFSLLSNVQATFSGFLFVTLKPWSEREAPEQKYEMIKKNISGVLSKYPQGIAFAFPPPAIPGVGTSGGVTF